jgi:hypothetical protein
MAFAIVTDATKVAPGLGQEDVSAKIDSLRGPHKTPTSARQCGQVYRAFDRNEDINVFWDRLGLSVWNPAARYAAHLGKHVQRARRTVGREAMGGAVRQLKVKDRGVGCDASFLS